MFWCRTCKKLSTMQLWFYENSNSRWILYQNKSTKIELKFIRGKNCDRNKQTFSTTEICAWIYWKKVIRLSKVLGMFFFLSQDMTALLTASSPCAEEKSTLTQTLPEPAVRCHAAHHWDLIPANSGLTHPLVSASTPRSGRCHVIKMCFVLASF